MSQPIKVNFESIFGIGLKHSLFALLSQKDHLIKIQLILRRWFCKRSFNNLAGEVLVKKIIGLVRSKWTDNHAYICTHIHTYKIYNHSHRTRSVVNLDHPLEKYGSIAFFCVIIVVILASFFVSPNQPTLHTWSRHLSLCCQVPSWMAHLKRVVVFIILVGCSKCYLCGVVV
jgi:hypothetical protein